MESELDQKDVMVKKVKNIYYDVIVPYIESSKSEVLNELNPDSSFLFVEFFKEVNKYFISLE